MNDEHSKIYNIAQHRRWKFLMVGGILVMMAVVFGLWIGGKRIKWEFLRQVADVTKGGGNRTNFQNTIAGENRVDRTNTGYNQRRPLQYGAGPVAPAALLAVLSSGEQTVGGRVQQLQRMRGILLSKEEHLAALAFLSGKETFEGMGKGSMHWLADELLTVMRLQEPPWDGLAAELANVAFQPATDPVVRDYIIQHLGHLWEQIGARKEIDAALWRAVTTADETTPGTALIALSRGYERDKDEAGLTRVRQQALSIVQNANTPLAVRVTALSIAGDGGGEDVKTLADSLLQNPETPVILRKVAERVSK